MKKRRLSLLAILVLAIVPMLGTAGGAGAKPTYSIPVPSRNSYPVVTQQKQQVGKGHPLPGLTHPCGGMFVEPPFAGLSPLAIAHVANYCSGSVYSDPYGDVYGWQADGHSYIALSG